MAQVENSGAGFHAAEQSTRRYLTGNVTPGWEITPFISSAKVFGSADEAEAAAQALNERGREFVAVPAAVWS